MTEAEWNGCSNPHEMLLHVRGQATDRKLRLIAVACCERAKQYTESWYHELADIAEAFADAKVTAQEMQDVLAQHECSNDHPDRAAFYHTAELNIAEHIPFLVGDLGDWIASCTVADDVKRSYEDWQREENRLARIEDAKTAEQIREILGPFPFRAFTADPTWLTTAVLRLAQAIYDDRTYDRLPVLADALEDAGCHDPDMLAHCRCPGPHLRGCWVVDLLTGRK